MAMSVKHMYIIIVTLGVLSFIFGVIAENKKHNCRFWYAVNGILEESEQHRPANGTAILGKGVVICKYRSDHTVALGLLSVIFLAASAVAGLSSLFYPYKGKSIPQAVLLRSTSFVVFLNVALGTTGLAAVLLLWPTISEQLHITRNIHHNLQTECPTANTGLLGGGAFLSLDSALFWLVCLMLSNNARDDYFEDTAADLKGGDAVNYEEDVVIKSA